MSDFHFLRPWWLLALLPLLLLSWRLYRTSRASGDWRHWCDPALLPYILVHDGGGQPARQASALFSVGGLLAVLALAGPVWERLPTPAFRNDAALVIALDLSRIMEAGDIKPSRLERARFKIADILKQRKDGLTALLVYSGEAFTVTPLTDDAGTITSQLSALTPELMPAQGSRAEKALELAGKLLKQAGLTRGDVLLMTNGGSLGKGAEAARALQAQGYRVSVLGAGSEEGAPVPLAEGGFLQDTQGNIIVSKLAAPALRQLAQEGGGMFKAITADNSDVAALLNFFERQAQPGQGEAGDGGTTIEQWEERGPWLLLPLLPIAALAFRRGFLALVLLLALPLPRPAQADWQDWWQTRDQQASRAFQAGEHAKAAETFENPAWKAAAQYKAGQYAEAAKTLEGQQSADAQYNLGNALAKQGQYPEAVAAYGRALKLDPKHEDARHNKNLVEQAMQQQQQKADQKQNNKQNQQNQGKDGQQQQDSQQDQSKPQDSSKDRQPQDQQQQPQPGQQDQQQTRDGQQQQAQPKPEQARQGQQQQQQQAQAPGQQQQKNAEADKKAPAEALEHQSEQQQADEQWLRRIPDDPGGLLRRKFLFQYQQRQGRQPSTP